MTKTPAHRVVLASWSRNDHNIVRGYKLVRKLRDGSYRPLFIERTRDMPVGEWLEAHDVPTKGYEHRPGWHILPVPHAPHLSKKGRVWLEVCFDKEEATVCHRPESQGDTWFLARRMYIIGEAPEREEV